VEGIENMPDPASFEEDDEDSDDMEDVIPVPGDEPVVARCRFDDPEGAKKASASLTEVEKVKVEVEVLTGEEEELFWERTNERLRAAFENPSKGKSKGKGKKGKSKGKGKDKGKKGGKSKGKWRDRD